MLFVQTKSACMLALLRGLKTPKPKMPLLVPIVLVLIITRPLDIGTASAPNTAISRVSKLTLENPDNCPFSRFASLLKEQLPMFNRIFSRKSHETQTVNGIEIGRPVIGSANVPSQSFSTNRGSREYCPPSDRRPRYHPPKRQQVRRRPPPAPLVLGSLTVNRANGYRGCNDWSCINGDGNYAPPVRRTGAVRHPVNPLTRRQTFSGVEDQPGRQKDNRAAVRRSNAVRHEVHPLTGHRQSEPPGSHAGPGLDGTHVDLSTPFMPIQRPCPGPRPQVRRSDAVRHAENPPTARSQDFPQSTEHVGLAQPLPFGPTPPITPNCTYYPGDLPSDEVQHLPSRLKAWVSTGMTACDIGRHAAQMLDGRDKFLNNWVTLLIDARTPYTNIGRAVLKFLDIRDDATNEPLYDKVPSGFTELEPRRPLFTHDNVRSTYNPIHSLKHPNRDAISQPGPAVSPAILAPQPRRPIRMPFFSDEQHLNQFLQGEHSDGETDPEIASCRSSFEVLEISPGPERKVRFVNETKFIPTQDGEDSSGSATGSAPFDDWQLASWSRSGSSFAHPLTRQLVGADVSSGPRSISRGNALGSWEGIRGRGPFL